MEIIRLGKLITRCDQDGAIFGQELFRFNSKGDGALFDLTEIGEETLPVATFRFCDEDRIFPHANSVSFGTEYYEEGDAYPLLYANVYNNYANAEDKRLGMTCVYRILREGTEIQMVLVQVIEVGFCEDTALWRATPEAHGPRPYGNFLVDREKGDFWAYVMRNEEGGTRYFRFPLPPCRAGEWDEALGAYHFVLTADDIREEFTMPYYRYVQGGAIRGGFLYSAEGFTNDEVNRPVIRAVDLAARQETVLDLLPLGYTIEPEMIDFLGDTCYYSDAKGNFYELKL